MARSIKLEFKKRRLRGFSGNQLKLIACFLMLCDHIGFMLIENGMLYGQNPEYWMMALETPIGQRLYLIARVLRFFGRMAFPLFAFLTVEGFLHTSNLKKYMGRMAALALISEVPFDLACRHVAYYPAYQNVCFTLLLGLFTMALMRAARRLPSFVALLIAAGVAVLAELLRVDYGAVGIAMIVLLYVLRTDQTAQLWCGAVLAAIESFDYYGVAAAAFVFIRFYNGKRGTAPLRYFFYLFYPLHMLLFYLLVYFGNR